MRAPRPVALAGANVESSATNQEATFNERRVEETHHGAPAIHDADVFHCHILEHEENEMMRPYTVVG